MEFLILLLTFLFVVAVVVSCYGLFFRPSDVATRRLDNLSQNDPVGVSDPAGSKLAESKLNDVVVQVTEPLQRLIPLSAEKAERLQKKLGYAGYSAPQSLVIYRGIQLAAQVSLPLFVLVIRAAFGWALSDSLPWVILALFIGYVVPRQALDNKVSARQQRLRWGLADAMDLLSVSIEAGLGLNEALQRVSQELRKVHPDISNEFEQVHLEIQVGQEREIAFRKLAERTGVDDLRGFCATLIQADRFGTSVVRAIRTYSDSLRIKRRQRAEQSAQKAAVKLLLPLALFMFPTLFIIILGPAFIQIMRNFVNQ